jgi:hypothetical protein
VHERTVVRATLTLRDGMSTTHEDPTMTDHQQDQGIDAPLDVTQPDVEPVEAPGADQRVDAQDVPGNMPTGKDESIVDKLLRVGTDAPDAADIEDPEQQL